MNILKKLRAKLGITIRKAAKDSGLAPSTIFHIEEAPPGHVNFTRYVLHLRKESKMTDEEFMAILRGYVKRK